jgi:hypothetical protein
VADRSAYAGNAAAHKGFVPQKPFQGLLKENRGGVARQISNDEWSLSLDQLSTKSGLGRLSMLHCRNWEKRERFANRLHFIRAASTMAVMARALNVRSGSGPDVRRPARLSPLRASSRPKAPPATQAVIGRHSPRLCQASPCHHIARLFGGRRHMGTERQSAVRHASCGARLEPRA